MMPHNLKRILVRCHTVCKVSWFICLLGRYRKRHFSPLPKHVPLQRHPEYQGPIPNKHHSNIMLQLESKDCFNFDRLCLDSNFPHFRNLFFPHVFIMVFHHVTHRLDNFHVETIQGQPILLVVSTSIGSNLPTCYQHPRTAHGKSMRFLYMERPLFE